MQIICISRGTYSGGKDLAERLASKLGYECVSREELIEEATKSGIAVGKLEAAIVKRRRLNERLSLEKDHYSAFVTHTLCQKVLEGKNILYHGRTGHFLMPGAENLLKIRVIADLESRINSVMTRLGLSREKAKRYIEDVEEDRRRWVHTFYNVDWHASELYDLIVNLERISTPNAAAALCSLAELPEFKTTPASVRTLENLNLAARTRIAIARDERTFDMHVQVQAMDGAVTVSYLPRQSKKADVLQEVISKVEGVRQYRTTMAMTNILWLQERYNPDSEVCDEVVNLAERWNAAVELLCVRPSEEGLPPDTEEVTVSGGEPEPAAPSQRKYDGGIEEDTEGPGEEAEGDDHGVQAVMDRLYRAGRGGGVHTVQGSARSILNAIDRTREYSLIVVGDLFLSKGHAAQVRLTQELRNLLADNLRLPVVEGKEMKAEYRFGGKQAIKLLAYFLVAAAMFAVVWTFQIPVLRFVKGDTAGHILPAIVVAFVVPLFAYFWGTTTKLALKIIKIE